MLKRISKLYHRSGSSKRQVVVRLPLRLSAHVRKGFTNPNHDEPQQEQENEEDNVQAEDILQHLQAEDDILQHHDDDMQDEHMLQEHYEEDEMQEDVFTIVAHRPDCLPPSQCAITTELVEPLEQSFLCRHWNAYHTSFEGERRSKHESATILRSVVKLILRIHYTALMLKLPFVDDTTAFDFLVKLVTSYPLQTALNNVIENYPFVPETLKSHLLHLLYSLRWLSCKYVSANPKAFRRGIVQLTITIQHTVRGVKKEIRRVIKTKDRSIKSAVEQGKYPSGGRGDLVAAIKKDVDIIEHQFAVGAPFVIITENCYNHLLETLVASLYVFSPQGRVGPLELLVLDAMQDFRKDGFTTSRSFKTVQSSSSQRYAAILTPKTSLRLLEIYIKFYRPVSQPRNQVPAPSDPLLLDYQGRSLISISRLVTSYFRRTMQLHITTTTLRSMIESEMNARTDLSSAERNAVHTIVGHSEATANDFYIYSELANSVRLAAGAFDPDGDEMELITATPQPRQYAAMIWGENHPDFAKPCGAKVHWTTEERDAICSIVEELRCTPGGKHEYALMASVLKVIKQRTALYQHIFHPTHIFNSARLRSGYPDLANKKKGVVV